MFAGAICAPRPDYSHQPGNRAMESSPVDRDQARGCCFSQTLALLPPPFTLSVLFQPNLRRKTRALPSDFRGRHSQRPGIDGEAAWKAREGRREVPPTPGLVPALISAFMAPSAALPFDKGGDSEGAESLEPRFSPFRQRQRI